MELTQLQRVVFLALKDSSQVARSIRHYLNLPSKTLLDLHREGLDHVNGNVSSKDFSGIADIIRVDNTETPVQLSNRNNFRLEVTELPKLDLQNCHHFELDLNRLSVTLGKEKREKFQITLSRCSDFIIRGGTIEDARNVCMIEQCSNFLISHMVVRTSEGYGIILFNSNYFLIEKCNFQNNLASGLYCLGDTSYGRIENNAFTGSTGFFNCDAGLHINHCTPQLEISAIPEQSHEPNSILEKTLKPSFLYIRNNFFSGNRAQGVYCEGCILSVIEDNIIERNNKEGICFDWGSALNTFRSNTLSLNGKRAAMSEAEIKADFIGHHPQLPDGSNSCKLPAISIDNGALNIIENNKVLRNYGGGVKMVRTGKANIIQGNMIAENGIGTNKFFKHYHAITLLGMGAGKTEFAPGEGKLDLMPSEKNIIKDNVFFGQTQHHAVYAGPGCSNNSVLENDYVSCNDVPVSDKLLSK